MCYGRSYYICDADKDGKDDLVTVDIGDMNGGWTRITYTTVYPDFKLDNPWIVSGSLMRTKTGDYVSVEEYAQMSQGYYTESTTWKDYKSGETIASYEHTNNATSDEAVRTGVVTDTVTYIVRGSEVSKEEYEDFVAGLKAEDIIGKTEPFDVSKLENVSRSDLIEYSKAINSPDYGLDIQQP